ncbi:hypothetical protein ACEWY4_027648 [Coilia grayii]|uniref:Glycosyltransferase 2-like domain-containing protein n=1 Tax=Coilia grayii TaxID=363190 RepID=A0ABD1IPM4_9TELE
MSSSKAVDHAAECVPAKRVCIREQSAGHRAPSAASKETVEGSSMDVSVIMPVYNASCWLEECLEAILNQDFSGTMELSVFDDASTDGSRVVIEGWRGRFEERGVTMLVSGHISDKPKGVGFAKNQAVAQSTGQYLCFQDAAVGQSTGQYLCFQDAAVGQSTGQYLCFQDAAVGQSTGQYLCFQAAAVAQSTGQYLCFQDADDVMMPERVRLQYETSVLNPNSIVGCQVRRVPEGSTERYTRWINSLSQEQLLTQIFTSHGPTVIMPTWFCSRDWFLQIGPFHEGGKGVPEDLLVFYESVRQGGRVLRVDECLLLYRYHEHAATHSVLE